MRIAVPLIASVLITCVTARTVSATEGGLDVPFAVLVSGGIPGATIPTSVLIPARNDAELRLVWSHLNAGRDADHLQAMPKVDFGHSTVVALFLAGGDNCDPYKIHRVIERGQGVTVLISHVQRIEPRNSCTCASFVFEPYIVIRIPSTEKPLDFEIEEEAHGCMDDV
jgi:hypothetical protein